jgi:hypothetical protein
LRSPQAAREVPPNNALHLTGAASMIFLGIKLLQAAPAGELDRSAENTGFDDLVGRFQYPRTDHVYRIEKK